MALGEHAEPEKKAEFLLDATLTDIHFLSAFYPLVFIVLFQHKIHILTHCWPELTTEQEKL